ncbi:hypothetical protein E2P84_36620 [Burkholderia cepacia]|uniref:Uncharacterized protein n=1 Tax=Burkholderia cepacia TaxID=292 RepID=A0AAX2RQK7_BURCE|nr:hypothetical protein [Burkholderia cepacia]TES65655.1 hypothetical protein E2P84_36620 [Burkholderia cepacia]TET01689.1 hypothetical protein E3D36_16775 [Burkholderia cepacia]TEU47547.1 hypothetical protein E3D37_16205 [Burkholderia cepacia]TEU53574.1 hypothetical protein E3D38_12595 [Burkholderia cepacia]TEV02180.1 hypothetical protein E3D40_13525 [Burkholderia cepacia]
MNTAKLDPRIGMLNNGKFYAFVNGYDKPEIIGTLDEVETALGLRKAATVRRVRKSLRGLPFKTYNVHMTFEFPAWDEKQGYWYDGIAARSKSEANKIARGKAEGDGHTTAKRVWFKATEAE